MLCFPFCSACCDQGLELGVVQKAVEVLEPLPAQLQLLYPQTSHGTRSMVQKDQEPLVFVFATSLSLFL
jgi:hypothetical protein